MQANGGASSYTDLLAEAPDMTSTAVDSSGNGGANGFGGPQGAQFGGQQGGQFGGQYGAQQGAQYGQGGQFGGQQPTGKCWRITSSIQQLSGANQQSCCHSFQAKRLESWASLVILEDFTSTGVTQCRRPSVVLLKVTIKPQRVSMSASSSGHFRSIIMPLSNKQSVSHLQADKLSATCICVIVHKSCMYALPYIAACLHYTFARTLNRAGVLCSGQNPFGAPPSSGSAPASNPFAAPGGYQGPAGQGGYGQQQSAQGGYPQQGFGGPQVVSKLYST